VAVVGAAVAVLAHRPPELRHREHHHVAQAVTEVLGEAASPAAEVAQAIGQLAIFRALRHVGVPAAHVGERDAQADVGAHELGDLPQRLAEAPRGSRRHWPATARSPPRLFSMRTASNVSRPVPCSRSRTPSP